MTQQQVINPKTSAGVQTSTVSIASLSFEHHRENETIGIGETRPRLSWIVTTSTNGWHQASYEIELYQPNGQLTEQTGRVESDQSVLLAGLFRHFPLVNEWRCG